MSRLAIKMEKAQSASTEPKVSLRSQVRISTDLGPF